MKSWIKITSFNNFFKNIMKVCDVLIRIEIWEVKKEIVYVKMVRFQFHNQEKWNKYIFNNSFKLAKIPTLLSEAWTMFDSEDRR